METLLPCTKKGAEPPNFWPMSIVARRLNGSRCHCMEIGFGPGHIVLDGDLLPPPKKGHSPTADFLAHVYCGQMTGWIKMPLGMKVGLGPSNIVFDADPTPPPRGRAPSIFGPCLLWPNGWMDQDATWYEGRPWPRPHCVTWGPSFPP